jgi:hypothetical protein
MTQSDIQSSSSRSPSINSISPKLGEHVGYFDDNGMFYFIKRVEIRKVNMHYKLLADNRAKFVRQAKLESKQEAPQKPEKQVLKSKVNHRKYIKKPGNLRHHLISLYSS